MNRRGFIQGLLALSGAALAAKLGAPEHMASEIREELAKELIVDRVTVGAPRAMFDPAPVWASVSGTASYWAAELTKNDPALHLRKGEVERMAAKLARKIDQDLATAMIGKDKQLYVGLPVLRKRGLSALELVGGLDVRKTIWGEEIRVEYIRPTNIVVPTDLRMEAEYAGLIVPV